MRSAGQPLRSSKSNPPLDSIRSTHLAMKHKKITTHEPSEQEIQHAAYLLWVEDGRPEGRDLEHWMAAKEMLCHRHGRDATTGHRAPEIAPPARVPASSSSN